VVEVDVDDLVSVPAIRSGRRYRHALVLVRAGGRPVGTVAVAVPPDGLPAPALGQIIRDELGDAATRRTEPPAGPPPLDPGRSLSVVVATRERPERLSECLDALLAAERPPRTIVVVDNVPVTDATARTVAARADSRIRYLVERRPGAASARATGLASVDTELVAFIDDDVLLDPGWPAAVGSAFALGGDVLAVTTPILPRELETWPQLWLEQFGGFNKGFERRVHDLAAAPMDDPLYPWSPGVYGSGAAMAFRTRPLLALGGFDPRLTFGGEDLDLFLRVVVSGHRLVYEPGAVAWHLHPADPAALRRTMFIYGAGLSGLMTKWALTSRAAAAGIARRLPAALRLALDPRSRKNAGKPADYPRELTRIELEGLLAGPFLFARAALAERLRRRGSAASA
jgi:GT2 family glycosyltransferase